MFPPEVAARRAAPLGVFSEKGDEWFGVAPVQRLGCGAKLLDHGRSMAWSMRGQSSGTSAEHDC